MRDFLNRLGEGVILVAGLACGAAMGLVGMLLTALTRGRR